MVGFGSVGSRVFGRRWRTSRRLIGIGGLAILSSSLLGAAPPAAGRITTPKPWQPAALQVTPSVPGRDAGGAPAGRRNLAQGVPAKPYAIPKVSWPSGSARTALAAAPSRVGALPVTLASADASAGAASSAAVSFASRDAAAKAGVSGVLFTVQRGDGLS
ncbi:MAG TPA: hypothetical protein VGO86_01450, partial [Candidatus Dormibacteraeota bacterium]